MTRVLTGIIVYILRPTTTTTTRTSSSTHWSTLSTRQSTSSSTTRSTSPWTWPSTTTQEPTSTTTRSTISWTWPSLSTRESSSSSSATQRPPLGLTTWSYDFVEYQIGDEVIYDGVKYRCVAPHRSYPGAEPGILTWAWWEPIEDEDNSQQ